MLILILVGIVVVLVLFLRAKQRKREKLPRPLQYMLPDVGPDGIGRHSYHSQYRKPLRTAEQIVMDYAEALEISEGMVARPISYLKDTKEEIKQSYKEYIARLKSKNQFSQSQKNLLLITYVGIDSFIDDDNAKIVNLVYLQRTNKETVSPENYRLYEEFESIIGPALKMRANEFLLDF